MSEVSFWLEGRVDGRRPALEGDLTADVAIVGGGFTGLWTAWYLLERDPSLDVVVLEAEYAGFGASGRNGGWCSPYPGVSVGELVRRSGRDGARRTVDTMRATVGEVGAAAERAGIDPDFRRSGILRLARGRHELPSMHHAYRDLVEVGADDGCDVLDAEEVASRVRVAGALGALWDPYGAVLHPGKLVRGLAEAVEAANGRVFEGTRVTSIEEGRRPRVRTERGSVTAEAAVLATEAWTVELPGRKRDVLPVYSLIVLTEPVPDDVWKEIGWEGHECLSSQRYTVDYLSRTADGRILFGGRGAPYHFGSAIDPSYDRHRPTHDALERYLTEWFPMLEGVAVAHRWGGAIGMPRHWLPGVRFDRRTGIAVSNGYTGQGVALSNLAGRILRDLILDDRTEHADLPFVGHRPRRWEPEPLRWLAARYLQQRLARIDERAAGTGEPPTGRTLAERLVRH